MRRTLTAAIAAAVVAAAPGCAPRATTPAESTAAVPAPQPTTTVARDPGLPDPGALTDVLYRLSDPAVPGAEKLNLVQDATDADAAALDRFAAAMRDNGYRPATFTAEDLTWAATSDTVLANVRVDKTDAKTDGAPFAVPMQFTRAGEQWQLTRDTFDMLMDTQPGAPEPPR